MLAFDQTPVNRSLGLKLVATGADGGEAEVEMTDCAPYTQEGGVVHGGVVTAVADTAAVYALMPSLPEGRYMTSIEFKMNFLRPARAADGPLVARARAVKSGRTVQVCSSDVYQGERHVAHGTFTYLAYELDS